MKTAIDRTGRIVIPRAMRERAQLRPGVPIDIVLTNGIGTTEHFWRHLVEDRIRDRRVAHWAALPNAKYVEIADAGHAGMPEAGEKIASEIRAFLSATHTG